MTNIQNTQLLSDAITAVTPFLKWAGGKRWLAPSIQEQIGNVSGRYIEPFLGSGAVFFSLHPKSALLNDANTDLIDTYKALKQDYKAVLKHLAHHQRHHSKEYYYQTRDYAPRCLFRRAAKFIYLNRTCWNGLYRVNLKGVFNVPVGTKSTVLLSSDNWPQVSALLQNAKLSSGDFESIIDQAKKGDLIFADPPYTVKHNFNGFIKYNEALFSWADQERLSLALVRAKDRGADVIATNANHKSVRELYQDSFALHTIERSSVLSGDPKFRGRFQELLILAR
ncbi:MAG: Dam family site-specific DNA-(adenine-N6)-methyltransferase [Sideroxyarcus sp.]|nr:Dam family site-specific DNA-(adenine-N6)-methyltransferase [Sideroxyarcus sp.]